MEFVHCVLLERASDDLRMESSSSLNCWVSDVLALCCKIKEAVEGKKAHINELQCISVKLLADSIQRYVKQWIKVCGRGAWWNLTEQVGKELLRVLDSGLQLVILCVNKDFEKDLSALPLVTLGFKGELSEIIDDARIYVQMINRFILHSLKSLDLIVEKLMLEVEWECNNLHFYLEKVAYQQDNNTLINSSKSQSNVPMSSLLRMLKTAEPNVNNSDLSEKEPLEYGIFGVVYRAEWHKIPVAVIKFRMDEYSEASVRLGRKLDSPHILRMLGYSAGGTFVSELMDKNLEKQITGQEWPLPLIQSLDLMLQIAKAMRYLHNMNVVHGDLKPANVMLKSRRDGSLLIKLRNFGIFDIYGLPTERGGPWMYMRPEMLHKKGRYMRGTPMYMAPEMEHGEGKYSRKVDIYSFGLICNEILTGKKIGQSREEKLTLPRDIPIKLRKLIDTCTELDDAKRPSFEDICDMLWLVKEELLTDKVIVEARELKFTIELPGMRARSVLSDSKQNIKQRIKALQLHPPESEEPSDVLLERARRRLGIDHVNHFNFAVYGRSGVGKSTFINNFLQPCAAEVKVTEISDDMKRYTNSKFPNVVFWVFPGAGTLKHPAATYFEDKMLYGFECILILSSDTFSEVDVQIAIQSTKWNKEFAMVRTKADKSLKEKVIDKKNWAMAELAREFREEVKESLYGQKNVPATALLFIISSLMYRNDGANPYENGTDDSLKSKGMDEKALLVHIFQACEPKALTRVEQ